MISRSMGAAIGVLGFFMVSSLPVSSFADIYAGDISHNCEVGLEDSILSLQVLANAETGSMVYADGDINGDSRVGFQ